MTADEYVKAETAAREALEAARQKARDAYADDVAKATARRDASFAKAQVAYDDTAGVALATYDTARLAEISAAVAASNAAAGLDAAGNVLAAVTTKAGAARTVQVTG